MLPAIAPVLCPRHCPSIPTNAGNADTRDMVIALVPRGESPASLSVLWSLSLPGGEFSRAPPATKYSLFLLELLPLCGIHGRGMMTEALSSSNIHFIYVSQKRVHCSQEPILCNGSLVLIAVILMQQQSDDLSLFSIPRAVFG